VRGSAGRSRTSRAFSGHDRPGRAGRAPRRGPQAAATLLVRKAGEPSRAALPGRDVTLLPASVQRPRPPVWVAGFWPHRRPMRRAARWDGVVPLFTTAGHGQVPPVNEVHDLVAYVRQHREAGHDGPFDVVLGGVSPGDPVTARELIEPLRDAGVTW